VRDSRRPAEPAEAAPLVATVRTGPVITSFAELGVPATLVGVLALQGIAEAFPIQSATLPDSLAGRDVLGRGRTGSGKTIAFALPLVARLGESRRSTRPGHPRALVLLPTRELASQVHATIAPLARAAGLSTTIVFGGVSQGAQVRAFKAGVDIVVATPGRLEDLMNQRHVRLDDLEVTVLDLPVVGRDRDDVWARVERLRGRTAAAPYAARTHAGTVAAQRDRHAALAALGVSTVFLSTPDLDGPDAVLELAGLNA
jgi:superfamily II helicase